MFMSIYYLCSHFGKSRKVNINHISQALGYYWVTLMVKAIFSRLLSLLFRQHFQHHHQSLIILTQFASSFQGVVNMSS